MGRGRGGRRGGALESEVIKSACRSSLFGRLQQQRVRTCACLSVCEGWSLACVFFYFLHGPRAEEETTLRPTGCFPSRSFWHIDKKIQGAEA